MDKTAHVSARDMVTEVKTDVERDTGMFYLKYMFTATEFLIVFSGKSSYSAKLK